MKMFSVALGMKKLTQLCLNDLFSLAITDYAGSFRAKPLHVADQCISYRLVVPLLTNI